MLIKDLRDHIGEVIECAIIDGYKIKVKRIEVAKSPEGVILYFLDSLGRKNGNGVYLSMKTWGDREYYEHWIGYAWNSKKVLLYPSKENAYRFLVNKLRQQRQEINKKIIQTQMEMFGKKDENIWSQNLEN